MSIQIPFQIVGLPIENFSTLLTRSDEELQTIGARRLIADSKPGFPCRVSLIDAELSEEVLLVPYTHHDVLSPYRSAGPIFVRVKAQTARLEVNQIPLMLRSRLLSLRAYDGTAMMVNADVVAGDDLEHHISRMFTDKRVEYLHVHNARPGCYNCEVRRA